MRNRHSMLFGLAVLLLIAVIGLPFLLKDFKSGAGQGESSGTAAVSGLKRPFHRVIAGPRP